MTMTSEKTQTFLLKMSGVILLITSMLKIITLALEWTYPPTSDPILYFLTGRTTQIVSSVLECGIGLFVLFSRNYFLRAMLVVCLGCVFLTYRCGLYLIGYKGSCACLGRVTSPKFSIHMV